MPCASGPWPSWWSSSGLTLVRNLSFFANWCYIFSFSLLFFFFSPQQKIGDYPLVSPGCELYPWLAVSCTANRAQCLAVHPAESAHCSYSAYSPTNHPYIFSKAAFYKINLQLILVRRVILLSQVQDIALVFAELCGSCGSFLQPAVFLLNSSPAL